MPSLTFEIDWINKRLTSKKIDGAQAVGQAVEVITAIERGDWRGYPSDFGINGKFILGKPIDFAKANAERIIGEALYKDNRIDTVRDMTLQVIEGGLRAVFITNTISGESIPSEVEIAI